ncbi:MAG TPA: sugar ABC transporter ATP-binding protein [Spirochaetes bacterium]|nr:sugar ABC transporter ATP-binding protein [Spirochaetota bacterium]
MESKTNLLQLNKITKIFPGVIAVYEVDFDMNRGEIHALVGENGAGKSTLIKILGGVYQPDGGKVVFDGDEVFFTTTHQSQERGISVIYQEFNLIPDLSVAENIFIGREPRRIGNLFINWKVLNSDAGDILDKLEVRIDPKKFVSDLTLAERQMVEIAKALSFRSKLIIMDEPTAALSDREVRKLFDIIKGLREEGVSIIYISHRLEEAFELSDRITVLRDGKKIGTKISSETSEEEIIEMMVGKVVKDYFAEVKQDIAKKELMMEVKDYSVADYIDNVSFKLYKGEILSIAGILGSGSQQLLKSLYGVIPKKAGEIYFKGKPTAIESTRDAIKLGIGYLTEDRKNSGILPDMSVLHNITIIIIKTLTVLRGIFIKDRREKEKFNEIRDRLDIKSAGYTQKIIYLSGGNQQKVVIGRILVADCEVLILLEPTRGIDVGAKAEVHKILRELANSGISIIMTSSELQELVNLPDRCIVLYKGKIATEFTRETMDEEKLVAAQIGQSVGD